jgi:hypothetical protein
VLPVCALASLLTKVLPTPAGARASLCLALVAGLYGAWQARDGGAFSPANSYVVITRRRWFMRLTWVRVPLVAAFVFAFSFQTIECGALAGLAAIVGQPASRTLTITDIGDVNGGCQLFAVREISFLADYALCAPADLLSSASEGQTITVSGKGSPLGLNADRYTLGPSAPG